MNAREIVDLLEQPTEDRRPHKERITAEAPIEAIAAAMHELIAPLTRQILCDIIGTRRAAEALPELLDALNDPSPRVRSAAADALASVRDPRSGPVLLEHFSAEGDADVRVMLAIALGAVGYRPAVPDLILALDDPDDTVQIEAAWSLGELKATEAREGIVGVLSRQTGAHPRRLVQSALDKLDA